MVPANFLRASFAPDKQSVLIGTDRLATQAQAFEDFLLDDAIGMRVGSPLTVPVASGGLDLSDVGFILWVGASEDDEDLAMPAQILENSQPLNPGDGGAGFDDEGVPTK